MNLPNCFILGAAKCGTTSLAHYLSQHPDFYISKDKEPHYFDSDTLFRKGLANYADCFFSNSGNYHIRCDATPTYLSRHDLVIERMKKALDYKALKFVVILRDPVHRAWSHYRHRVRNYVEKLSFESALGLETERLAANPDEWCNYFSGGLYGAQLAAWLAAFDRAQFCVVTLDELKEDPQGTVVSILRFLGLNADGFTFTPKMKNEAGVPRSIMIMKLIASDFMGRRLLVGWMPLHLKRRLRALLRSLNTSRTGKVSKEKPDAETVQALRARYKKDIELLETLLGKSFAEWRQ